MLRQKEATLVPKHPRKEVMPVLKLEANLEAKLRLRRNLRTKAGLQKAEKLHPRAARHQQKEAKRQPRVEPKADLKVERRRRKEANRVKRQLKAVPMLEAKLELKAVARARAERLLRKAALKVAVCLLAISVLFLSLLTA